MFRELLGLARSLGRSAAGSSREAFSLARAVFRAVRGPVRLDGRTGFHLFERHRPVCAPFSRSVVEREAWSEMVESARRIDRDDLAA